MTDFLTRAYGMLRRRWVRSHQNDLLVRLNRAMPTSEQGSGEQDRSDLGSAAPVVFFNASTRLTGLSLNAAYSLVTRWAVQSAGVPVINFTCQVGMTRCVLGTDRDDPLHGVPPCGACVVQSRAIHADSPTRAFTFVDDPALTQAVQGRTLAELQTFIYQGVPLGRLALPSIRWVLRRHSLQDDAPTRFLYGEYLRSAWQIHQDFERLLQEAHPRAVVVFNGMFFPEATARWAAEQRGIPVISHEVGLRPYTAFFTTGDATAYPIAIPDSFQLTPAQDQRLDAYLEKRSQGNFSMAGVRFWPEMRGLEPSFLERASAYRQIVPVFTNVIFDTSQPHSNVVFADMFAWLEQVLELVRAHPQTLFVIRAHPDEARPGKASRESVEDWLRQRNIQELPNLIFVEPGQYFSSYELIQRAKFVMVYNSTIGLEASLMGAAVLCAGKARFTQLPTVFFEDTPRAYCQRAEEFLSADVVTVPPHFRHNARRFLYYQLYCTSLPFDEFLEEDGVWQGYVRIKDLPPSAFDPSKNPILRILVDGILHGEEFRIDG